jgi:hypothetical protein
MTTQPSTPEKNGNQVLLFIFLKKIGRFFGWLLGFLLILFILFNLFLRIPYFQRSAVHSLSFAISTIVGTPITLDRISLSGLTEFKINKFYLEDPDGDTLIYADKVFARLHPNILKIFTRGLIIHQLNITDAKIYSKKLNDYDANSLDRLLKRFPNNKKSLKVNAFKVYPEYFSLKRITLIQNEPNQQRYYKIFLPLLHVSLDRQYGKGAGLTLQDIALFHPKVLIKSWKNKDTFKVDEPFVLPSLAFSWKKLHIENGQFIFLNKKNQTQINNLNVEITNACYLNGIAEARINYLSFSNPDLPELRHLSVNQLSLLENKFLGKNLSLQWGSSAVQGDFTFSADNLFDFNNLKDKIQLDLNLSDNKLYFKEIVALLPDKFNKQALGIIENDYIRFSGNIKGNAKKLVASNLKIKLSDGSAFDGKLNLRYLLVPKEEILNVKCNNLYIAPPALKKTIAIFSLDSTLSKFGYLRFNGFFDGFLNNFVATGNIKTDVGTAKLDMQLNVAGGKEFATYAGSIQINDFTLGKFLNQSDIGNISLQATLSEGKGLTYQTASANISAVIKEIGIKKYIYKDARLNGSLKANKFNGKFNIADENIDVNFDGLIDFTDQKIPKYEFVLDVRKLNLQDLLISKNPWTINGSAVISVKNKKWSDLEGLAVLSGLELRRDTAAYFLDHFALFSRLDGDGNKKVEIQSDVLEADFKGNFDIEKIPGAISLFLIEAFPEFSSSLAFKKPKNISDAFNMTFQAKIKKSDGWESLFLPQLSNLDGSELKGEINVKEKYSKLSLNIPNIHFKDIAVNDLYAGFYLNQGKGQFDASFSKLNIGEKITLPPFVFISNVNKEEIHFQTRLGEDQKYVNPLLELNGKLFPTQNGKMAVQFGSNSFYFLANKWKVDPKNLMLISSDNYDIQHLAFYAKDQELKLETFKQKGLKVSFKNLALSRIDSLIKFTIKFSGKLNAELSFEDWKGFKNLSFKAKSDALLMNKKDWGSLLVKAERPTENHPLSAQFSLIKGNSSLHLSAFYNVKDFDSNKEKQKGYFDLQLNAYHFPNYFAAYFLEGIMSNIEGKFDADIHFDGKFPALNTRGAIFLSAGGVTVDYLKTRYTFNPTMVPVNNQLFDLTGGILYDKYNHSAQITGGVSHNYLKKFGFKAKLSSKRFLCLDTQKGDNPTYYGQAIGTGDVVFSGTFKLPDIYVKASVSDSTKVVIPISSEIVTQSIKNMRFVNKLKEKTVNKNAIAKPIVKGLSFDMDLEAKAGAMLEMVFNEQTGDVLKVTGRGGVRLSVLRNDPFKMFGDISIDDGSYLFTYLAFNKEFRLRPRGTISWNGDPYKAIINIEATYENIMASTAVLIQDFLVAASQNVKSEASQNTQVVLLLKLQGDLFKPNINFDIIFPSLQGALKNYVDSKLRILKQDQNELNKQVFGLIIAGQFLPTIFTMSETAIVYNTVSEFISNQFSLIVNKLIANLLGGEGKNSGTNFDIAFNRNPNFVITDLKAGNELQVSLKQSLFNDRITVMVGGNLDNNFFGSSSQSTTFLGNDLAVEYNLNKDKSLKFRVYQKLQPDFSGRRLRFGAGISYRKEFESFADFINSLKKND